MKEEKDKGGAFEALGRIIGYLHVLPVSILGVILMIFGLVHGIDMVASAKGGFSNHPPHYDGPCIFSGLCVVAGALLQIAKSFRK